MRGQRNGDDDNGHGSHGAGIIGAKRNSAIHNSVAAGVTYVVAAGNSAMDAISFSPANSPGGFSGDPDTYAEPLAACRT